MSVQAKIIYGFCLDKEDISKKVLEDDNIVAESVDFENSSDIGVDGECVLVGICINSGDGHYSGVLEMPVITQKQQQTLDAFVSKYPQFSGFERHSYVYYRTGKSCD